MLCPQIPSFIVQAILYHLASLEISAGLGADFASLSTRKGDESLGNLHYFNLD